MSVHTEFLVYYCYQNGREKSIIRAVESAVAFACVFQYEKGIGRF